MADSRVELATGWLKKARNDLGSARRLAQPPEPFLDTAIYHCQQAAEKALKAYLVFHDIAFERTHNLSVLLELCVEVQAGFDEFEDQADLLTPYATAFRYPAEFFEEPDEEQVQEAIGFAESILNFVLTQMHLK
ncbi:MAG: HEPN domain-containing protein [bacterium]